MQRTRRARGRIRQRHARGHFFGADLRGARPGTETRGSPRSCICGAEGRGRSGGQTRQGDGRRGPHGLRRRWGRQRRRAGPTLPVSADGCLSENGVRQAGHARVSAPHRGVQRGKVEAHRALPGGMPLGGCFVQQPAGAPVAGVPHLHERGDVRRRGICPSRLLPARTRHGDRVSQSGVDLRDGWGDVVLRRSGGNRGGP
mmetsp:Transcript_49149/g.124705  ORF Transcript_49149/g.124705 Transcript_49149/m.124705 type:complete len:200 (+) Transcript_49149:207-806(+)